MKPSSAMGTQSQVASRLEQNTSAAPEGVSAGQIAPTLLNVESFSPLRSLRTGVLRAAGYDVIEAGSAREALQAAMRRPLSGAVVGANLPDSSGVALCDTLKRFSPGLAVLLISSSSVSPEAEEAGLAAGAHEYLGGSIAAEALVRSISNALNGLTARPEPDVWLLTDGQGFILDASPLGARLLGCTVRGLSGRNLLVFFEGEREAWRTAMDAAVHDQRVFRSGRLRPKERRPVRVRVEIARTSGAGAAFLQWAFVPDGAA